MSAQASLPGIRAEVQPANRATLESDLRGEVALAIMALLTWAEFHGGRTALIDGTVERFITAGKPADSQVSRAIEHTRRALARYLERGGITPAWFPKSINDLVTAGNSAGS